MANNSNKKQSNSTGKRGSVISTGNLINLLACVAICVSVVVYIVNLIVSAVNDGGLGVVGTVMTTIKDICVVIALGVPTLMYARGKKQWVKLIIYVLLVVFLVLAILGNVLV